MKNKKLTEIFLYVCFIGRLIRQFFVCPDWVPEMQEQEADILTISPDTRADQRLIRNRMRRIRLRNKIMHSRLLYVLSKNPTMNLSSSLKLTNSNTLSGSTTGLTGFT